MRKLLLTAIILIQLNIWAQSSVYKPFCNNPSWTVVSSSFGMSYYTTYQYQADTIIGSYTYKKITDTTNHVFALFRENISQKKVYQYDTASSVDYLYIDFNLNYGDSFNLKLGGSIYSLTVCAKDSMQINGCYHNKIVLSNDGCFVRYNFVEGILSDINPIYPFTWPGDPQVSTVCECHNGQFYHGGQGGPFAPSCNLTCSPAAICSVVSGINELNVNGVFTLQPNPTEGIINFSNEFEMQKIEVHNITGQTLLSESVNSKEHQLQLQDFAEGIYFVRITYPNGLSTTKKIVVNR